ncbi:CheY-like superfamily [Blyttiomyces helicus]|uniref:CheY-like superfamily n=1 Tax=Blyttiomyces helicus TaxID=388810 RepID=A0A4P9WMW3_9FUNG|nr:CheY-like superfamily [Blyttiomyces helicus]|eukprot:RKO94431.1 CheY-like superfamily [Blyttiomyces helicus]
MGHNVFVASNGQEAIDMFKTNRFSIIFLDIELPIKDGLTVAREMREWETLKGLPPTPIIGVSGFTHKAYKSKAIESGMNYFLSKGIDFQLDDIYKIVVELCGVEPGNMNFSHVVTNDEC